MDDRVQHAGNIVLARLAIADLVYGYAHAIRLRDVAVLTALFAEEATFEVFMAADGGEPRRQLLIEGREAIEAYFRKSVTREAGITPLIHNLVVTLDPTCEYAVGQCLMVGAAPDGTPRLMGVYHDEFARQGDWRFTLRRFTIIGHRA